MMPGLPIGPTASGSRRATTRAALAAVAGWSGPARRSVGTAGVPTHGRSVTTPAAPEVSLVMIPPVRRASVIARLMGLPALRLRRLRAQRSPIVAPAMARSRRRARRGGPRSPLQRRARQPPQGPVRRPRRLRRRRRRPPLRQHLRGRSLRLRRRRRSLPHPHRPPPPRRLRPGRLQAPTLPRGLPRAPCRAPARARRLPWAAAAEWSL